MVGRDGTTGDRHVASPCALQQLPEGGAAYFAPEMLAGRVGTRARGPLSLLPDAALMEAAHAPEQKGWKGLRTRHKGDWQYGRVEVCAKLPPHARGLWSAIWLLPSRGAYGVWPMSGEIDVMESVGWQPAGTLHATLHTASFNHRLKNQVRERERAAAVAAALALSVARLPRPAARDNEARRRARRAQATLCIERRRL